MGAKQCGAFCPASWIKLLSHSESGSSDSEIINNLYHKYLFKPHLQQACINEDKSCVLIRLFM